MGIFDIEGTDPDEYPDNHGGRPIKDEQEENQEQLSIEEKYDLNIYRMGDGKEFWKNEWESFYEESKDLRDVISLISGHTMTLPRTAVCEIHANNVHDFRDTEDEYPEAMDYISKEDLSSRSDADDFLSELMDDDEEKKSNNKGVKALLDGI